MNTVKVTRQELLDRITANRKNHRDLFLKAQQGYRKKVIEALDQMLAEARDGKAIRRHIELPEPEDHTDDYDRTITMLQMSVEDHITISAGEFDRYVMDNWAWKATSIASTSLYVE